MHAGGRPKGLPKTGGRKKGVPNIATRDVRALAGKYAPEAIKELARLALGAESEAARVAAIRELLDRACGKAAQPVVGDDTLPAIKAVHEIILRGVRSRTDD